MRAQLLRDLGGCLSPFNAFLILQGVETLPLRMQRHSENGLAVARVPRRAHPRVPWVSYPGLASHPTHARGATLPRARPLRRACSVSASRAGATAGRRFVETPAALLSHLANIGDAKSLVIHPASTTHSQLSAEELVAAA